MVKRNLLVHRSQIFYSGQWSVGWVGWLIGLIGLMGLIGLIRLMGVIVIEFIEAMYNKIVFNTLLMLNR